MVRLSVTGAGTTEVARMILLLMNCELSPDAALSVTGYSLPLRTTARRFLRRRAVREGVLRILRPPPLST